MSIARASCLALLSSEMSDIEPGGASRNSSRLAIMDFRSSGGMRLQRSAITRASADVRPSSRFNRRSISARSVIWISFELEDNENPAMSTACRERPGFPEFETLPRSSSPGPCAIAKAEAAVSADGRSTWTLGPSVRRIERTVLRIWAGLRSTKSMASTAIRSEHRKVVSRSMRRLAPKSPSNSRMTAMSDPPNRKTACQSSPTANSCEVGA